MKKTFLKVQCDRCGKSCTSIVEKRLCSRKTFDEEYELREKIIEENHYMFTEVTLQGMHDMFGSSEKETFELCPTCEQKLLTWLKGDIIMKKIPTLFIREFENHRVKSITDKIQPGLEWVLKGEGTPTVKWDGACCAIINGEFYKRYDALKGKKPPVGAIPWCDPDPVTGHHPHWVTVDDTDPADKWFRNAFANSGPLPDGTYEAIGKHFNGNPYNLGTDELRPHGSDIIDDLTDRSFAGIKDYLQKHNIEGIVFWRYGEPKCKIKKKDFGLPWNV